MVQTSQGLSIVYTLDGHFIRLPSAVSACGRINTIAERPHVGADICHAGGASRLYHDMEDVIISEPKAAPATPIVLTERAVAEVMRIMEQNSIPDTYGLRVGVKGGGCSGLSYTLAFDADKREGAKELTVEGVRLFIDSPSLF